MLPERAGFSGWANVEHFKRDCFSSGFEFVDQFLSLFVSKFDPKDETLRKIINLAS
ncbi:hypothetical protein YC2023_092711 [Brassica napus]